MAMLNRRQFVATLSGAAMTEAAALSAADQATQWFPITADDTSFEQKHATNQGAFAAASLSH